MTTTLTPVSPVLAHSVEDDAHVDRLCADLGWIAQQKIDGVRCVLHIDDAGIVPYSRSGLRLPAVKPHVLESLRSLVGDDRWVIDGEYLACDDTIWLFDLIIAAGQDAWRLSWDQRQQALEFAAIQVEGKHVKLLPYSYGEVAKRRLVAEVKAAGGEGVVFKRRTAPYAIGKRSRDVLKAKNRNELDAVVTAVGINGKANMAIALWEGNRLVNVGECGALTADGPRVKPGDVVTIYYHGASADRRIVQPTYPRIRTDKPSKACTIDQLVFIDKRVIL